MKRLNTLKVQRVGSEQDDTAEKANRVMASMAVSHELLIHVLLRLFLQPVQIDTEVSDCCALAALNCCTG